MSKKSELLRWLRGENQKWENTLKQIDPSRMVQPAFANRWSIKDLVAHLTGWQIKSTADIQAAQRGEPAPPTPWPAAITDGDDVNAWLYETYRNRALVAILEENRRALQNHLAVIEGLPEDVEIEEQHHIIVLHGKRFATGEFFDHFRDDHEPDLRAWLAQSA